MVVIDSAPGAIVNCLDEIEVDADVEVNSENAVLEFYSHDPNEYGFVVDYQASKSRVRLVACHIRDGMKKIWWGRG